MSDVRVHLDLGGALFRLDGDAVVCRGCGRVYETTSAFAIDHHAACRHVRMFDGICHLYDYLVQGRIDREPAGVARMLDRKIADIVCALLGPCDDLYAYFDPAANLDEHIRCDQAPNHGGNHAGLSKCRGRVVWVPRGTP